MFKRLLAAVALAAVATQALAGEEVFALPGGGGLVLMVPDGWKHEQQAATAAISLTPRAGKGFVVQLTPLVRPDGSIARNDTQTLRKIAEDGAQEALARSEEKSLPVQFFFGATGRGFYFSATDRAPKPGEFKHLTQGVTTIHGIPVTFTILSDPTGLPAVDATFQMLKSAQRR